MSETQQKVIYEAVPFGGSFAVQERDGDQEVVCVLEPYDGAADDSKLIADAMNVKDTTGRTPRELAERVDTLEKMKVIDSSLFDKLAAQKDELAEHNTKLRYLLACAYSGAKLYGDDGQLQDGSAYPLIDYVRMTPDQIEAAMTERARAALARNGTE